MEQIILIAVIGIMNILCFFIGAKIGQKVARNETITMPKIEPVKTIREYNEQKEVRMEQERDRVIAENIDNYDGTGLGQKDVPKVR